DQQQEQRDDRIVTHEPLEAAARGDGRGGGRGNGHLAAALMARKAPSITTTTMMVPSMMAVAFGSTDNSVRSVRSRRSTNTATIGPTRPPRPPPSTTPPSTVAATLASRYGPGMGAPIP